jgi:hypothetical protein
MEGYYFKKKTCTYINKCAHEMYTYTHKYACMHVYLDECTYIYAYTSEYKITLANV